MWTSFSTPVDRSAETPPHRADTAGHVVPLPQESRGGIEIGDHGIGVRQVFCHQGSVLSAARSDLARVEIGGKGDVTLVSHRVGYLADSVHQTVPLVDQDQGGEGALTLGDGQVPDCGLIASVVGQRLAAQPSEGECCDEHNQQRE